MRDLLVVSIVGIFALLSLRRPWLGVMLWTWLSLMNPHRFTWGFAYSAPLAAIAAVTTVLGLALTRERQSPFSGGPVLWFVLFCLWLNLSWLFGENLVNDLELWSRFMKMSVMMLVALMLLHNRYQITAFVAVTAGSLAVLGAKGGVFTLLTGGSYRVWGPPGSFVEGNNEFALALITIIPLLRFIQLQCTGVWLRRLLGITMLLCAVASIGSYSRGAFLALGAMALMFWWRSRSKVSVGLVMLFLASLALFFMPDEWWSRMNTIKTYEEDMSAIGRLNGWAVALQVALHNLFGAGMSYQYQHFFTLYGPYNDNVIAAHSVYFQILGNHGFIGLALFMAVWISTYRSASWVRRNGKSCPEGKWAQDLGGMLQVSLVGYGVGGAFLSLAYFDLPYNIVVVAVVARKWIESRGWESDPKVSFLEYVGLRSKQTKVPIVNQPTGRV